MNQLGQFVEVRILEAALLGERSQMRQLIAELNDSERDALAEAARMINRELLGSVMPTFQFPK